MNETNPWRDLVEAADEQVRRALDGDATAAIQILGQAVVALRSVLQGLTPDPEARVYLAFLEEAVTQITDGVSPEKALALWTPHRPASVSPTRDLSLFFRVGQECERLRAAGVRNAVQLAKEATADKTGIGLPTVEKAWQANGGMKAWRRIEADLLAE